MSEAELRIKPVLAGDVQGALSPVRRAANNLSRDQQQGMRRSSRAVDRLRTSYRRVSDAVGRVRQGVRSTVDRIFSMRTAIAGIATGMAGRTVFDSLIGSNIELEQQRVTFEAMLGDVEKAEGLMGSIREFAASTPFAQGDLIEGSRTLLRHTEDNVEENERLLNVAAEMSALTGGERGVAEAAEALTRAGTGQMRGLRSFGVALTQSDVEEIQRDGEELGDAAVRAAVQEFENMTGGRDLVGMLSQTVGGRISTLKDNFSELMREAGEPAFEAFGEGVDDVTSRVEELRADPQFMEQMEDFGEWMGDVARHVADIAPTLIDKIPSAVESVGDVFRQIQSFYDSHPGLVKFLGGTMAANHLSGGMLSSAAGGLVRGGVGAMLGGRGGRGAGAASSAMGGCCCPGMSAGGRGGGAGVGSAAGAAGRAAAGGLSAAQLGTVGVGAGGGTALASGGAMVAGGAAIPAATAAAMLRGWQNTLESEGTTESGSRIAAGMERNDLIHSMRRAFEEGDDREAALEIVRAMGGASRVYQGTEEDENVVDMVQAATNRFGMDFDMQEGQTVAQAIGEMEWRDSVGHQLFGASISADDMGRSGGSIMSGITGAGEDLHEQFGDTTNNYDIDMHFENPPDSPEEMQRMLEEAARQEEMRR